MKTFFALIGWLSLVSIGLVSVIFIETSIAVRELNLAIAKEPEFSNLTTFHEGLSKVYTQGSLKSKKGAKKFIEIADQIRNRRTFFKPRIYVPPDTGFWLRQSD